ncbi:MAG: pyrroline-5-carboxylate reductase [Brooklawnia sp.]|jgi:pyrroline-5-carboxylate reductase
MTAPLEAPVTIIGGGVMGGAIATGLVANGWSSISVVEASPGRRAELAGTPGLNVVASAAEVVEDAQVVALVVKPKDAAGVLDQIADQLPQGVLVMSMCAGVGLQALAGHLPAGTPLIRVMPNTPAQVGSGMAVLSPNQYVGDEQLQLGTQLMSAVGAAIVLPESAQDAVTAISGSGPAYVFYLAEAMIEAGVQLGLSRADADQLTRQTIIGAGQLLATGEHPGVLRERVTSPGGTTAAAIRQLDANAVRAGIADAIWAAFERSRSHG